MSQEIFDSDRCAICDSPKTSVNDQILYCDGKDCNIPVHQSCYGIPSIPEGEWYCEKCVARRAQRPVRVLCCPMTEDGALHRCTTQNDYLHVLCARYNEHIQEPPPYDIPPRLRTEMDECCICHQVQGFCVKCNADDCTRMFHVTCGVNSGWIQVAKRPRPENLQVYCTKHQGHVATAQAQRPKRSTQSISPPAFRPTTPKPVAFKPAAPKPAATKLVATKPAATKLTATKPAAPKPEAPKPEALEPAASKPPLSSHQAAAKITYLQQQLKSRTTELSQLKEEQKKKQEQFGRIAKELHLQEDSSLDTVLRAITDLRLESRKHKHIRQGCATLFKRLGLTTTDGIAPSYDTMEAYLKSLQRSVDAHPLSDADRIDIVRFAERKARKRAHPDPTASSSSSAPQEKRKKL
ncbi:hypothetical protein BCR43DRAFT_498477 [Syncephalastrum racemosum]|uniref:PHD-type domain-containing protein n=1 Tax=Syncephalastrum racemosum TaxID=13706 RepID=A0A1X2H0Z1_SYNRA|nr:hypothetical protein BCR43DRAFT_498477 [Syncephalastrum racemosum]